MPVQAPPAAVGMRTSSNLRTKLLHLSEDRSPIHLDPALRQQIGDILVRGRKPAVPAHGKQDHPTREPISLYGS